MRKNTGTHIIAGFPGTRFGAELKYLIRDIQVGGIIFFKENIIDPYQLAELCACIQKYALNVLNRPLFLAIDHEGGKVQRTSRPFTYIPAPAELARKGSESVERYAKLAARELKCVGINMNLAPVADISPESPHKFLHGRTYGNNPQTVTFHVTKVTNIFLREKIIPTVKHFPGLGEAKMDPHKILPMINRSFDQMNKWEFIPFRAAIENGTPSLMTSHAMYSELDRELPATLSRKILVELLRKKMNYRGIVISDDLEMGAISGFGDFETIIQLAIEAENDFLLLCHDIDLVTRLSDWLARNSTRKEFLAYHRNSLKRINKLYPLLDTTALIPRIEKVKEYFENI